MRRALLIAALAVLGALAWLYGAGGIDQVTAAANAGQESAQRAMAGALRALRAGEAGALAALWSLCFTYGFFHAVGPGHGKILIGGYGLGAQIPLGRLSGLALAASLAQGLSAVLLVALGGWLLGWGRQDLVGAAELWFAPVSYGAIALIGLWLVWRGVRGFSAGWSPVATTGLAAEGPAISAAEASAHVHAPLQAQQSHHTHLPRSAETHAHHTHAKDDAICATCGHAHGPSLEEAQSVQNWRDATLLIGAIALRPCTGALFVLILTFRWGLIWQGVSAVIAMALGVAAVTIAVGFAAVSLRDGALRQGLIRLSDGAVARGLHFVEMLAGGLVVLVAGGLLLQTL